MQFPSLFLSCFFAFFSCVNMGSNRYNNENLNMDKIFINWNKATLLSLNSHINSSSQTTEKEIFKNRLLAFKAFIEIDKGTTINHKSIRYQFLNEIFLNAKKKKKDFYVIEANRSGEAVELRNYLVYINSQNSIDVDIYNYVNGKWIKNMITEKLYLYFDSNLKGYATKFGLGFNQDDVIITQFNNNTVSASEYYLYSTFSDVGNIKKIFLLN